MNDDRLETVELSPAEPAELVVLWLHGLGADGHDFAPIVQQLSLPCPVRFVFPHAPERRVTINGGLTMRAWYDILTLDRAGPEDEAGIRASAAAVSALIDREIERGVVPERIVLAGFSQGGAVVLHAALREPRALAGVMVLSAYLPLAVTLAVEKTEGNAALPIWMAHGDSDPVIEPVLAEQSRDLLRAEGYRVDWHTYPMGHAVCPQEIDHINSWLGARASI